jgi:sortase (surface protein transpeptidase)
LGLDDEIRLVSEDGQEYRYRIVAFERFLVEGVTDEELAPHTHHLGAMSEPTLTLITCWPYESNTHRVVVTAKLEP